MEDTETAELKSFVEGEEIHISNEDLSRIDDLTQRRLHPAEYRIGEEKDIMKNMLLREADREVTGGFTKPMLKRKYRLLFEIMSRVTMGITSNPNQITQEKRRVMAAIIDKVPDLNWVGLVKHRFLDQQSKVKINSSRKVEVTKKISLLHKAALILMDELSGLSWHQNGMKKYLPKLKALLWKNAPLTGLSDDDLIPTKRKNSVAISAVPEGYSSD